MNEYIFVCAFTFKWKQERQLEKKILTNIHGYAAKVAS